VIILVTGMLAAQLLTSSIWYHVRHGQVLEIPARLVASRMADILRTARENPAAVDGLIAATDTADFALTPLSRSQTVQTDPRRQDTETLIRNVIRERTGIDAPLQLLSLELLDDQGERANIETLLGASPAIGHFLIELALPDGRHLQIDARETQGWSSQPPGEVLLDIFWRVYLVRILVIIAIALFAVHLAVRPLRQLAAAAQALGQDIHQPPLPIDGPLEVRRAARTFNDMQQRLIENLAERTRFFAAVSHDLRTPVTRMRLRTEMLADDTTRERFRRDLDQMEAMVSATLDFAQSGENTESRDPIDINALLRGLQADFQDMGERVELTGEARSPLAGYPQSLRRALQNLLDNAIRYGDWAHIQVYDSESALRIIIKDHGPGIPEGVLGQVFEPFYRLEHSRSQETGGYGLGLSIAEGIVRAHGGRLTLRNSEAGGLQAIIELDRG
jgi:signal transduction histidine kinase